MRAIPSNEVPIPDQFWQAIQQFNQQEFYACHDTLEALWMEAPSLEKKFYQGILQIAVACYHLGNQNWGGTVILLGEGMMRLSGYQPIYSGIDVSDLITQSAKLLTILQQTGSEKIANFQEEISHDHGEGASLPKIIIVETCLNM